MASIDSPFHGRTTEFHLPPSLGGATSASTLVGEVGEIGNLELSRALVEFMSYGDDFSRKLVGNKESGAFPFTLNWVPGDTDHQTLVTAFENATLTPIEVKWVAGANFAVAQFQGYISSLSISQPIDDKVTASFELAIDGDVTFDVSGV